LSFNNRVLQEACNENVPLLERLRFLAIFSSNLDEFFRVKVAALLQYVKLKKSYHDGNPKEVLSSILTQVKDQQVLIDNIFNKEFKPLLTENQIYIVDETQLDEAQKEFVKQYFRENILPDLSPIMLDSLEETFQLKDPAFYFIISLAERKNKKVKAYALLEIPGNKPRFLALPGKEENKYVIILDDIIRLCFKDIFGFLGYDEITGYTLKVIRDAELDIDSGLSMSLLDSISKSVKKRKEGAVVRFTYDSEIPPKLLEYTIQKLKIKTANIIPGGRYRNFRDFSKFPNVGSKVLEYSSTPPLYRPDIDLGKSLFAQITKRDFLISVPYQSFDYVITFLREAALDPNVTSIRMTLYRMAGRSRIINALTTAAKNGKKVVVLVELKARFDEESNIYWTQELEEAGVKVMHGLPEFKVHSKICLVNRKKKGFPEEQFAILGTGNYNEITAKIYTDYHYFTCSKRLTGELDQLFNNLEKNIIGGAFRHLVVSPISFRKKMIAWIDKEIASAKKGNKSYIILKINGLTDEEIIEKLYQASKAGVKIQLIVRGICRLEAGVKGLSDHISCISIVDKFLEHARVYIFSNGGKEKLYLSSADLMPRNIDYRIEVTFPVLDIESHKIIRDMINIQLNDNVKARIQNPKLSNEYKAKKHSDDPDICSQIVEYNYFKNENNERNEENEENKRH
jgi:polyphosphate kinase